MYDDSSEIDIPLGALSRSDCTEEVPQATIKVQKANLSDARGASSAQSEADYAQRVRPVHMPIYRIY